jgi:hypothetical protein
MDHGVPMEDGDHSQCSVELLACPEHRDDQLRAMDYEPGTSNMPHTSCEEVGPQWHDKDGKPIIGFCLWCPRDFYTYEEVQAHNANDMADCIGFQQYKARKSRSATKITDLKHLASELRRIGSSCNGRQPSADCRLIASLTNT